MDDVNVTLASPPLANIYGVKQYLTAVGYLCNCSLLHSSNLKKILGGIFTKKFKQVCLQGLNVIHLTEVEQMLYNLVV